MIEARRVNYYGDNTDADKIEYLRSLADRDISSSIGTAAVASLEFQQATDEHHIAVAATSAALQKQQDANWRVQMAMRYLYIALSNHIETEDLSDKEITSLYLDTLSQLGFTEEDIKKVGDKLTVNLTALESGATCFIIDDIESGDTPIDLVKADNVQLSFVSPLNATNIPGILVAHVNDGQNVIMIQSVRVKEISQDYAVGYIQSAFDANISPLDLNDILVYAKSRHSLDMSLKLMDAFRDSDNKLPAQLQQQIEDLCRIISKKMEEAIRSDDLGAISNPALTKMLSLDEFSKYIDNLIITMYANYGFTRPLRAVSLLMLATGEVTKQSVDETMKDYEDRVKKAFLAKIPKDVI